MPEHRAKQVLNIVRVQPGLRRLGAAGGDEVLLACRVEGREVVLLFDFDDLLDDAAALGQQFHQLLVDGVDLDAQVVEVGFWAVGHRGQGSARVGRKQGRGEAKAEIRRSKAERRPKPECRVWRGVGDFCPAGAAAFGFRTSGFGLLSAFDLRPSGFAAASVLGEWFFVAECKRIGNIGA
jgi:hypothetical protein